MYRCKIAICDDESIIREGLKDFVIKFFPQAEIIGVFSDGSQVIEFSKNHIIDILISDIRMSGKTGLEAVSYIKQHNNITRFILITGFQDFEYAKKSIDLHVSALITKPIDFEQLLKAINNAIEEIDANINSAILSDDRILKSYSEIKSMICSLFNEEITIYVFAHSLNEDYYYLMESPCAVVDFAINDESEGNNLNDRNWCDLGEIDNENYISFCIYGNCRSAKYILFSKKGDLENCAKTFCSNINSSFVKMCSVNPEEKYLLFSRLSEAVYKPEQQLFEKYRNCVTRKDKVQRQECLHSIIHTCSRSQICNIIDMICEMTGNCEELINELEAANDKQSVVEVLKIADSMVDDDSNSKNTNFDIIDDCLSYINQNYSEYITLESISEKYHLSLFHFCRIFKKETGSNFKTYLTTLRLQKAKELLLSGKHKVKDIAVIVGFDNSPYFGQVFKKYFGCSPHEFLRNNSLNDGE